MLPLRRALATARPSTLRASKSILTPCAPSQYRSAVKLYSTAAEEKAPTEEATTINPVEEATTEASLDENSSAGPKFTSAELAAERKALMAQMAKEEKATGKKPTTTTATNTPAANKRAAPPNSSVTKQRAAAASSNSATPAAKTSNQPRKQGFARANFLPEFDPKAQHHAWNRGALSEVDWQTSYKGIAEKPVFRQTADILLRPLAEEDVEVKPDGIIYLPEIKYRRKLNEAFGPMGWGLIPRGDPVVGDSIVTREYCLIVDGRFVAQAQGENQYFGNDQLPSAVEGCKSNALMRCCKDLGIASELWDPTYIRWFRQNHMESRWVENTVNKKKKQFWFKKGAVEVAYPWKVTK